MCGSNPSTRPCEAEDGKPSRVQKTALRIRSLSLVPPPFLHSGGVGRVSAQAPSPLGRVDRRPRATAPPASRSKMGSCGAVGSVRARYLVFFQYLGTDFKYVFPLLPPLSPLDLAVKSARWPGGSRSAAWAFGLGMRNFRSLGTLAWTERTLLGAEIPGGTAPTDATDNSFLFLSAVELRP